MHGARCHWRANRRAGRELWKERSVEYDNAPDIFDTVIYKALYYSPFTDEEMEV